MDAGLPADVQNLMLVRELVREARESGNVVVDKLSEAPVHVAGVDDEWNRFDWYHVTYLDGSQPEGYIHVPKGVQL